MLRVSSDPVAVLLRHCASFVHPRWVCPAATHASIRAACVHAVPGEHGVAVRPLQTCAGSGNAWKKQLPWIPLQALVCTFVCAGQYLGDFLWAIQHRYKLPTCTHDYVLGQMQVVGWCRRSNPASAKRAGRKKLSSPASLAAPQQYCHPEVAPLWSCRCRPAPGGLAAWTGASE